MVVLEAMKERMAGKRRGTCNAYDDVLTMLLALAAAMIKKKKKINLYRQNFVPIKY